jgi:hypothetical protein
MAGPSGLSSRTTVGIAQQVLATLSAGSTASPLTVTPPLKVLFLSTIRTNNDNTSATTDTEWPTYPTGNTNVANGYVAGTGQPAPAWQAITAGADGATVLSNAAVTQTNCPAVVWIGNIIRDSTATNKELWYAPLSGGQKTVNQGDTCTIPSGSLTLKIG